MRIALRVLLGILLGVVLAEGIVRVAAAEGFRGHAQSVLTRFEGE